MKINENIIHSIPGGTVWTLHVYNEEAIGKPRKCLGHFRTHKAAQKKLNDVNTDYGDGWVLEIYKTTFVESDH